MKTRIHRLGLGKVELIVLLASVVLIVAFLWPVLQRARCGASSLKDKVQIQQIHKSWVTWSADHDGELPVPGRIRPHLGLSNEPIAQDFALNHSAPLYSMLIMSGHVNPDLLVSSRECIEVNRAISVKNDYDFGCYDPVARTLWDSSFSMRIDDPNIGANGSYAHMSLCGNRRDRNWRSTAGPSVAMIGTRGTRGGVTDGEEYTRSPTLRLHGPEDSWYGHVCFGDGHSQTLDSFFAPNSKYTPDGIESPMMDNIYAAEFDHPSGNQAAVDNFVSISKGAAEFTVADVYDPLE